MRDVTAALGQVAARNPRAAFITLSLMLLLFAVDTVTAGTTGSNGGP